LPSSSLTPQLQRRDDRPTLVEPCALRRWLVALVITAAVVILCIAYVDRPVARWVETHVRNTRTFDYLDDMFAVLPGVVPLALLVLFVAGCIILTGRQRPAWLQVPLLSSWSVMWALAATLVFKHLFGRTGADPEFIAEGKYEFAFLHGGPLFGGPGHDSFPSGTMAVAGSCMTVLWVCYPRLRLVWGFVLAVIAVALVMANFHFVGDVIGGTYLGALIGCLTVLLLQPTEHQ
jgi:membrane-associated phospholipid phosphatase